jgi:hypothetical protein
MAPHLATVAAFQMTSNVGIHSWPVEALHEAFLGLVDAIVSGEQFAVSLGQGLRDECSREKKYHSTGFELSFDPAPNQTIFDKAIIGE